MKIINLTILKIIKDLSLIIKTGICKVKSSNILTRNKNNMIIKLILNMIILTASKKTFRSLNRALLIIKIRNFKINQYVSFISNLL
jgi:hypothetical protein